jgi:hypothetical protein
MAFPPNVAVRDCDPQPLSVYYSSTSLSINTEISRVKNVLLVRGQKNDHVPKRGGGRQSPFSDSTKTVVLDNAQR